MKGNSRRKGREQGTDTRRVKGGEGERDEKGGWLAFFPLPGSGTNGNKRGGDLIPFPLLALVRPSDALPTGKC